MQKRVLAWGIAAALLLTATNVSATTVTVVISGRVAILNDASDLLMDGSVRVGTPYTLTMSYDDSIPDLQSSDPNMGQFVAGAGLASYVIEVGNYTFTATGPLEIGVINDDPLQQLQVPDALGWFVQGFDLAGTLNPAVALGSTRFSNPFLLDSTGFAHSSDALTGVKWDLAAYDSAATAFNFSTSLIDPRTTTTRDFMEFFASIEQIAVVPEAGSTLLLVAAALSFMRARRR